MKNNSKNMMLTAAGLLLLLAGLVLVKTGVAEQGMQRVIPYVLVGIGTGMFGHNLGEILKHFAVKNDPKIAREIEIEMRDERNTTISNKAKAKAYDLMLMTFGGLLLVFALMQVDFYAVLLLAGAYLFVVFTSVYYMCKYRRER